jgi:branched-chain amino acid transport system substrate-binding protein
LNRARRLAAILLVAVVFGTLAPAARAADPYEINVILSLTGQTAFIGTTELQALKALEGYVNATGGIGGRTLTFVAADDQTNPQVALQLAQSLIAKHVPIILGPTGPASCAAITPLVAQNGPLLYCLGNAGHPPAGSYAFLTLFSAEAMMAVVVRYYRERGFHRLAYIVSTDAAGQDAESAFLEAMAKPENTSIQIVAREHFAPNDLSVAAQLARIKAATPDGIIGWAAGTLAGTLFRGMKDAGVDLPTVTSPGNLNAAFFKQYGPLLPTNLYFAGVPYYGADTLSDRATKAELATLTSVLAGVGAKPDQIEISAWDPARLLVSALRKLGPDASAAQLRAYLVNLKGWVGANGPYDFTAVPQRGLGEKNIIIVRWDARRNAGSGVSKFGGEPLPGK